MASLMGLLHNSCQRPVVPSSRQLWALRCLFAVLASVVLAGCAMLAGDEPTPPTDASFDEYTVARQRMVAQQIQARGVAEEAVLRVMATVPRHEFVPERYRSSAYEDRPLPIGYGQTISQPYIVALMTEHLAIRPGDRVLEIGTGSGYQAAVLAELTNHVYSVEIIEELAREAAARLSRLRYNEVRVRVGDGYFGWEEYAPFDAIIVTAAPDHIPRPLINQLADGGRLVIPVGPPGSYQTLWKVEKQGDRLSNTNLGGVMFVPFTGQR